MRKRILVSYTLLIVIMLTFFVVIINHSITASIEHQYDVRFRDSLNIIEELAKKQTDFINSAEVFTNDLTQLIDVRFTIINNNGVVLADNYENFKTMDNHANRPEIVQASAQGEFGTATRFSNTVGERFIYVVKCIEVSENIYYIRLSEPMLEIAKLSRQNIGTAVSLGVVAALIVAMISWFFSTKIIGPIRGLIEASNAMAEGNYSKKIYVASRDEVGELAGSFNVLRENLSHTMATLTTRNAELKAILNSMLSGIIAVDTENNIILINKQCFDILNLSESVISVQDSVFKVVKNQKIIDMVNRAVTTGNPQVEEIVHVHTGKVLRVNTHPITVDHDRIMGTIIIVDDFTQIRRLEGIRSEFVSNVTHELKTPLTSILGFIDTLKSGALEDKAKAERFLTIIETEAERLNRLISDILILSEIENSQAEKEQATVEVGEVIGEVMDMLSININKKPLELSFTSNGEIEIEANRDRVKQMLINLIDNAIKYTEEGHVKVSLTQNQECAIVSIEDTGSGFSESEKSRLFERFYRLDKARSRRLGGTGLGLSIVKHIVNLYRGEIVVQSQQGEGSTFVVSLPIRQKPQ